MNLFNPPKQNTMEENNEIKVLNQFIGFKVQFIGHGSQIRRKEYGWLAEAPFSGTEFGIINEEFLPNNHVKCFAFYKDVKVILKPKSLITHEDDVRGNEILGANPTAASWLKMYQFLQSKGYDLPQYLLGDKTLKEAGLAIYEEDLK